MTQLARTVSVAALITAAAPVAQAQAQEMRARLAHVFADGSTIDLAAEQFAACIAQRTDGAINITVFPAGQLGGDEASARDMARGALEFAFLGPLAGLDPLLDIHYIPYVVSDFEQADAIFHNPDGVLQTTLREALLGHGIEPLSLYEVEFRAVTNSRHPVETLSDLEGLKVRVPGARTIQGFFDAAGAQPVTMPFPELFVALQQGTVDGQDNGVSLTWNSRLFEAQDFMTLSNHVYATGTMTVGAGFFADLSEPQKDAVRGCAETAAADQIVANRAANDEFVAKLKEAGIPVVVLSPEAMAEFVALGQSLWDGFADTYGAERIKALRAEVAQLQGS